MLASLPIIKRFIVEPALATTRKQRPGAPAHEPKSERVSGPSLALPQGTKARCGAAVWWHSRFAW